jgi:hypothetical protein
MDIQTINLDSLDGSPSLKLNTSKSESSNLLGVEMLMNDKKKPTDASSVSSPKSDINLGDLQSLEAELNDLSGGSKKKQVHVKLNRHCLAIHLQVLN